MLLPAVLAARAVVWVAVAIPPGGGGGPSNEKEARVYADGAWSVLTPPSELEEMMLRAVEADGSVLYANPSGQLARWDLDSAPEQFLLPEGASYYAFRFDDSSALLHTAPRGLAGGGQPQIGAEPELEVVSSY